MYEGGSFFHTTKKTHGKSRYLTGSAMVQRPILTLESALTLDAFALNFFVVVKPV